MIVVDGLTKRFDGALVLGGVSFQVSAGSTAAILGPSGAGKSTLLRCLTGLERFDGGTVRVDETLVEGTDKIFGRKNNLMARKALRGKAGLVFQSFELFPHLDVLANCVLGPMKTLGVSQKEAEARAAQLLEQLGLAQKLRAFPEHLSGGQRQRVAIARALSMEPRVLLYDEPTSALDPSRKREVLETVRSVGRGGVTQIVVTHDVWLARNAAEQVFILDEGRIVESGPSQQVLEAPSSASTRKLLELSPTD